MTIILKRILTDVLKQKNCFLFPFILKSAGESALEATERKIEFFVLEVFCNTVFTIEIILRFIASPNKLAFIRSFPNTLDIVAVLPFWTNMIINNLNAANSHHEINASSMLNRTFNNLTGTNNNYKFFVYI